MQARRLYRSDGTASGTYPLTDTSVSVFLGDNDLVAVNGYAYFPIFNNMGTIDLWKSDGTPSGTAIVKGGFYSGGGYGITGLDAYGNLLVFTAFDSINGRELWRSDGTEAGTFMIKDINTGSAGSIFGGTINVFMEYGGEIFFEADDGINGEELWKSDGTEPVSYTHLRAHETR